MQRYSRHRLDKTRVKITIRHKCWNFFSCWTKWITCRHKHRRQQLFCRLCMPRCPYISFSSFPV